MAELLKVPEQQVEWIVEGLLRTGRRRPSLSAGKPETGKSTLAWQLAVAVTKGARFLGRATTKGKVIFWQSEEEAGDVCSIVRKLGYSASTDAPLLVLDGDPEENSVANLRDELVKHPDTKLVIIETLDDLLKLDDIKENTAARKAFDRFQREVLSRFSGSMAFLALHHIKKREVEFSGDGLLGATVIRGRTDAKIYLKQVSEEDPRRLIRFNVRKGLSIPWTYLTFDEATLTATLGETLVDERRRLDRKADGLLESNILDYFAHNPGALVTDMLRTLKGKEEVKRTAFKALVTKGLLHRSGTGAKGDPFRGSLAEAPQEVVSTVFEVIEA
jgi:hypothetical protein